jgi:hypothetical protein
VWASGGGAWRCCPDAPRHHHTGLLLKPCGVCHQQGCRRGPNLNLSQRCKACAWLHTAAEQAAPPEPQAPKLPSNALVAAGAGGRLKHHVHHHACVCREPWGAGQCAVNRMLQLACSIQCLAPILAVCLSYCQEVLGRLQFLVACVGVVAVCMQCSAAAQPPHPAQPVFSRATSDAASRPCTQYCSSTCAMYPCGLHAGAACAGRLLPAPPAVNTPVLVKCAVVAAPWRVWSCCPWRQGGRLAMEAWLYCM